MVAYLILFQVITLNFSVSCHQGTAEGERYVQEGGRLSVMDVRDTQKEQAQKRLHSKKYWKTIM